MAYDPDSYREAHRRMWQNFVKATIWVSGIVILVLVLMAIFLL